MVEVANGRSLVWGAEAVQALRERLGVGGPHGGRPAPRAPPELAPGPPAAADARRGAASGRDRRRDPGQRPAPGSAPTQPGKGRARDANYCGSRLGVSEVGGLLGALDSGIVCMQDTRIPGFGLWGWEESGSRGSWLPKAGQTWILAFPPAYFSGSGILQTPARTGLPGAKRPGS